MPSVFPGPWPNNEKATICNFTHQPIVVAAGSAVGTPVVTVNTTNAWLVNGNYFEQYNTVATSAVCPTISAANNNNGLNLGVIVNAASKQIEITEGILQGQKNMFVTRTSAPFFIRATFNVATLANVTDLWVGFRKIQAYSATPIASYTDYAVFGVHSTAGHLQSQTNLASAGVVTTDSTNIITAATNFTVQVNVDGSGNVTYLRDITGNGPLIAPTTVAAYQFAALNVVPFIGYTASGAGATEVDLVQYTCGFQ